MTKCLCFFLNLLNESTEGLRSYRLAYGMLNVTLKASTAPSYDTTHLYNQYSKILLQNTHTHAHTHTREWSVMCVTSETFTTKSTMQKAKPTLLDGTSVPPGSTDTSRTRASQWQHAQNNQNPDRLKNKPWLTTVTAGRTARSGSWGSIPGRLQFIFRSIASKPAVGPTQTWDSFVGRKWPGCKTVH